MAHRLYSVYKLPKGAGRLQFVISANHAIVKV